MRDVVNNKNEHHTPVMLKEMLDFLEPRSGSTYIDCTFGAGSYTKSMLESCDCKVIAIDQDSSVLKFAQQMKDRYGERFEFLNENFGDLEQLHHSVNFKNIDGIVFDLGVSSMQLDQDERGFSFKSEAKLDMRMSNSIKETAYDVVNFKTESEIADIIYFNGDERFARKIAKEIVLNRRLKAIESSLELTKIVHKVIPRRHYHRIDPATKTFQAIRIYVNNELNNLEKALKSIHKILEKDGKLVVVSFHSLEDKIVKDYLKSYSAKKTSKSKYAKSDITNGICEGNSVYKIITKKPLIPSETEIKNNNRSRSAKMRAAIKINNFVDHGR